jgi:GNAT superfamily N-acetyltransferase
VRDVRASSRLISNPALPCATCCGRSSERRELLTAWQPCRSNARSGRAYLPHGESCRHDDAERATARLQHALRSFGALIPRTTTGRQSETCEEIRLAMCSMSHRESVLLDDGSSIRFGMTSRPRAAVVVALGVTHGRMLGRAEYTSESGDARTAHVAVNVAESWRRRGLGRRLLIRLAAHARSRGVREFTAALDVEDGAALALARIVNAEVKVVHREAGMVRYALALGHTFCDLCGKQIEWQPDEAALRERRPSRVCSRCLERYVPKIQARLADPWWV